MGKPCKRKLKFKSFIKAKEFAANYMEDIVLTFYPMKAFYCLKHKCYHVGHDKYSVGVDKNLEIDVD